MITVVRSNNWISHSQFIWITHCVDTPLLTIFGIPSPHLANQGSILNSLACFAAHIMSEWGAQTGLTCPLYGLCGDHCVHLWAPTLTGDPGLDTAEWEPEPRLAPAPAWAWAISLSSSASQLCQYLSWSTVNKYKPHLFLGATHSSSSVVSIAVIVSSEVMMDDGGFIGSDSEKERGGGPCYQFYCYDIPRLPPLRLGDHCGWGIIMCGAMLRLLLAVTSDNVLTSDRCWPRPGGWPH